MVILLRQGAGAILFALTVSGCGVGGSMIVSSAGTGSIGGGGTDILPEQPVTDSGLTEASPNDTTTDAVVTTAANVQQYTIAQAAQNEPSAGSVTQSSHANPYGVTADTINVEVTNIGDEPGYLVLYNDFEIVSTADGTESSDLEDVYDQSKGTLLYERIDGGIEFYRSMEAGQGTLGKYGPVQSVWPHPAGDFWIDVHTELVDTKTPDSRDLVVGDSIRGTVASGMDFEGYLNGVKGTFVCTAPCALTTDEAGDGEAATLVSSSGYEFDPVDRYLAHGLWIFAPDDAYSFTDYEYGAFSDGNHPFFQDNVESLAGTATYYGRDGARGVFANATLQRNQPFEGDVTLTVNFGMGGDLGTIGGWIDDIAIDGEALTGNPALALEDSRIGDSHSGFFAGDTSMNVEGRTFTGKWGGQFHGNGSEASDLPSHAAGTFGATTADGGESFLGAFGARELPDPAAFADSEALANVVDLVANYDRYESYDAATGDYGPYIGTYLWNSNTSNQSSVNHTHRYGEHPYAVFVWHDEDGRLQHIVELEQNGGVDGNTPLKSSDPYVQAHRYIDTSEDPENLEGITTVSRPVFDHDIGSAWQVSELTNDYEDAGALKVFVATDLETSDMSANPYAGSHDVTASDVIHLDDIPDLPAGRDYLWVRMEDGEDIPGSLGGVAGDFSCSNSSGCWFNTVHAESDGYLFFRDGVSFTPDVGTTQELSPAAYDATAGAGYLAFGYWLYAPADPMDSDVHEFGTFASGGDPFTTGHIPAITGTATYVGDAAGMYYVGRSTQNPDTGSFAADVELAADFGTNTEWGTIAGKVNNFSFEGDVVSMFPETLDLTTYLYANFLSHFDIDQGHRNIFDSWPGNSAEAGGRIQGDVYGEHDGLEWYGYWSGKFFGNGVATTDIPVSYAEPPSSVAGTFGVIPYDDPFDYVDGADKGLVGAFGAHIDSITPESRF